MPKDGNERCRPPEEDVVGVARECRDGDDWKFANDGLELGVGGMSGVARAKLSWLKPGVRILRFVGFFRPLRGVSLNGEVGSEKGCRSSTPVEVAGLGCTTVDILIVRFLGFLFTELPFGDSDLGFRFELARWCCGNVGCPDHDLSWLECCIVLWNMDKGGLEDADSGEEAGEGSVNTGEEWVVVGDEAVDVVLMEVILPR